MQIGKYRLVFFSGHVERLTVPATASHSARARLNIGQVLDQLRPDFPGVTIPKIRFLEDKGLVKPERTPSGYRKFSADDVERLRYILRMQRDHYLPLRVIGEHLDASTAGLEPPPLEPVVPTVPRVALLGRRPAQPRVVRAPRRRAALAPRAAQDRRDRRGAARPARALRPGRPAHGHRPLRHRRPGHRRRPPGSWPTSASSRATCARSRPPPTARSAWSSRSCPPLRRGHDPAAPGPRRGDRHRDRRPLGAAARHPGQVRPASRLTPAGRSASPGGRVERCAKSTSWESGSRCPPTSRSCCCARSPASATCRSGSVPSRRPRSPSPSRASCRRGR